MKLSDQEKQDILAEATDLKRRADFERAKEFKRPLSPDDYLCWLTQLQEAIPIPVIPKQFVTYKNVLI